MSRPQYRRRLPSLVVAGALGALAALSGTPAQAQLDDIQLRLVRQLDLPLRWDNVEDADPYWLGGRRPAPGQRAGWHTVRLAPGERTSVLIPAGERLRVLRADERPFAGSSDEPVLRRTNGSGVALGLRPLASEDGLSLVAAAFPGYAGAIDVERSPQASGEIELALFVSRRVALPTVAPYRRVHPLPGARHTLRRSVDGGAEEYWLLAGDAATDIVLRGPARYALQGRFVYPATESALLQDWSVRVLRDGDALAEMQFESAADSLWPIFVDGVEAAATWQQEAYVEIPGGEHRVTLQANAPFLARLLEQEDPDYLLPALNEPAYPAREARREEPGPVLRMSTWMQETAQTVAALAADASPAEVRMAGLRLLQDNRRSEGGTLAAAAMQHAAGSRRDAPAAQDAANTFAELNTFFRDLLPADKRGEGPAKFAWYLLPRLNDIGDDGRGAAAGAQHLSNLLAWLDSSVFLPLPDSAAQAHVYPLPERHAPVHLRIVAHVDADAAGGRFFVQFDDAPPFEMTARAGPEFPAERYQATAGETALLLLQRMYGEFGAGTLSGAFAATQVPALLIPAGTADLVVPPGVGRVRAWREQGGGNTWLALRLRQAKPYALAENAFLQAASRESGDAGSGAAALVAALAETPPAATRTSLRTLDSHLQPLARLVRSEHRALAESIAAPATGGSASLVSTADAEREALALEAGANWLPALEKWATVASDAEPARRERAEEGRIRALLALGESFLAEQRLKQRLLYGTTLADRQRAAEMLAALYRRSDDRDAMVALASAAFVRDPDSGRLARLAEALQAAGAADLALAAGFLLPSAERPTEALLRAAVRAEWWQAHAALLATLPDAADRDYWHAWKALRQGRVSEAAERLAGVAAQGQRAAAELHDYLVAGLALQAALPASGEPAPEEVAAWGEWLAAAPGERVWQEMPTATTGFAGSAGLHSIARDTAFTMHRAEPGKPVKLAFFGPATLRIEARPLHRRESPKLIEGWLRIREQAAGRDAALHVVPIIQNPPADDLAITGDPAQIPGRGVSAEIGFAAGWHDIEIDGENLPLLVRSQFARAELPLPVLPPLTADTVVRPSLPPLPPRAQDFFGCFRCTVLLLRPDEPTASGSSADASPPGERLRPAREELFANPLRLARERSFRRPAATLDPRAVALASGHRDQLLAPPAVADERSLPQHFAALLWIAEHAPERYDEVVARASALAAAYPQIVELRPPLERLLRRAAWVPLTSVHDSAGLRSRSVAEWEPENPALRIRRALLPPTGPDEYLLSGSNRLVLSLFNPRPVRLRMTLAGVDVSGYRPLPSVVRIEADGRAPRRLPLAANGSGQREEIALGVGEHTLRVSIENPLVGQFVRIAVDESGRRAGSATIEAGERFYQVATPAEPVRVRLPGPAWLRVDEWANSRTESRYQLLPDAWNELVLKPDGPGEGLYRLFVLGPAPDQPVTPPRIVEVPAEAVPPPPTTLAGEVPASGIRLVDGLPLGGQEDGTWSLYGGLQRRSFGNADHPLHNAPHGGERYVETGASYRRHDANDRSWYRGDLFVRARADGNPTLGARASLLHAPIWSSWNFGADASLYLQNPGGNDGDRLAHAASLRAFVQQRRQLTPRLYHSPALAAFVGEGGPRAERRMPAAYRDGRVDQDVYTPYRAHHRSGSELADTLVYEPWLDTQLRAAAKVTSNPDFNLLRPDHYRIGVGAAQLLGPVWLNMDYGHLRYRADDRRASARSARTVAFGIGGEVWLAQQQRLEIGLTLARDIDDRSTWGGIVFTWHGGNGRGFQDFRPGERDFGDLRYRRASSDDNNRLRDLGAGGAPQ